MERTPLFEVHRKLKARLVDFEGWEMPLSYTGVVAEHRAVRESMGLFDICHMGRLSVTGADAQPFLQHVTVNNISLLKAGSAHYSLVCNRSGGVRDDIFIYRKGQADFFICVNASNREKIFQWFLENRENFKVEIRDLSKETGMLALQGPRAPALFDKIAGKPLTLKHWEFKEMEIAGIPVMVARTGYTGERGYEFYFPWASAEKLWSLLFEAGKPDGLLPVGLGARDTLRLEMGYPLYGHELSEEISPLEAGLENFVHFEKPEFVGKEPLLRQKEKGVQRILIGFELKEKSVPRQHCRVLFGGKAIGEVTSGNLTPSVQKGIGMALVESGKIRPGSEIEVEIREKRIPAVISQKSFYKKK